MLNKLLTALDSCVTIIIMNLTQSELPRCDVGKYRKLLNIDGDQYIKLNIHLANILLIDLNLHLFQQGNISYGYYKT